jgi:hypothetical protein
MYTDKETKWEEVLEEYIEFAVAVGMAKLKFRNELRAISRHEEPEDAKEYLADLKQLHCMITPS